MRLSSHPSIEDNALALSLYGNDVHMPLLSMPSSVLGLAIPHQDSLEPASSSDVCTPTDANSAHRESRTYVKFKRGGEAGEVSRLPKHDISS
jgi:hypothetical protein